MKNFPIKILTIFLAASALLFAFAPFFRTVIPVDSSTKNLIANGDFSGYNANGLFGVTPCGWGLNYDEEESIYDVDNKLIKFTAAGQSVNTNGSFSLNEGAYKLSFNARTGGTGAANLCASIRCGKAELYSRTFTLTDENVEYSEQNFCIYNPTVQSNLNLEISLAESSCDNVYLDDVSLTVVEKIVTENGASIRNDATDAGLRFKGRINKPFYDYACGHFADVSAGLVIAPYDFIEGGANGVSDSEFFTVEAMQGAGMTPLIIDAKIWNNESTAERDGYYGFNCVITDICPENTDREFAARAYLSYKDNGEVVYVYADFAKENHCRSIFDVANAALNDVALLSDDTSGAFATARAYASKITEKYISENFSQPDESVPYFEYTERFETAVIAQLMIEESALSDNCEINVTVDGDVVTPKNGYYVVNSPAEFKITLRFTSYSLIYDVSGISLKTYKI